MNNVKIRNIYFKFPLNKLIKMFKRKTNKIINLIIKIYKKIPSIKILFDAQASYN